MRSSNPPIPIEPVRHRWRSATWIPGSPIDEQRASLLAILHAGIRDATPLAPWIRALADEYPGGYRFTLRQLASLIDRGVPWLEALEQSPGALAPEAVLALRLGHESQTLLPTFEELRRIQSNQLMHRDPSLWRNYLIYWFYVIFKIETLLAGVLYFIGPTILKMMQEFEIPRERSAYFISALRYASYPPIIVLVVLIVALAFAWSHTLRHWVRQLVGLPGQSYAQMRAAVIGMLSIVVEHKRPIDEAVATLAKYHFSGRMRRRLQTASKEIDRGTEALDAIRSAGLISQEQRQCLEGMSSTEQAWVLGHLADSMRGHHLDGWKWVQSLLHPIVILALAASVFWFGTALFDTLYGIIIEPNIEPRG